MDCNHSDNFKNYLVKLASLHALTLSLSDGSYFYKRCTYKSTMFKKRKKVYFAIAIENFHVFPVLSGLKSSFLSAERESLLGESGPQVLL